MTKLGAGVDKLQVNLLHETLLGQSSQGLSQSKHTLLVSNTGSLDHDEVLLNHTVVGESTHGVDGLVGDVKASGTIVLDELTILHLEALSNSVDLLVDLSSVMETLLSSPGN